MMKLVAFLGIMCCILLVGCVSQQQEQPQGTFYKTGTMAGIIPHIGFWDFTKSVDIVYSDGSVVRIHEFDNVSLDVFCTVMAYDTGRNMSLWYEQSPYYNSEYHVCTRFQVIP